MKAFRAMPALLMTASLVLLAVAGLSAHLRVQKTMPADQAELTVSPDRIQVWFSQKPVEPVSKLTLKGPGGEVGLGAVEVGKDQSIVAAVKATLEPGAYTATWRTAGDDGHPQEGTFTFSVKRAQ